MEADLCAFGILDNGDKKAGYIIYFQVQNIKTVHIAMTRVSLFSSFKSEDSRSMVL